MTLQLVRESFRPDGIFSRLILEDGTQYYCLEHSYDCKPKIYDGEFTCVRGQHQLAHMSQPFETFEITGVQGHSNILIHVGNWNSDSEGCVLIGDGWADSPQGRMIVESRIAFTDFMNRMAGIDSFQLTVSSP